MRTAFLISALSSLIFQSALASKGAPLCEKNPSAPQCVQSRAKIPPSLPERYALGFLVSDAKTNIQMLTHENAGEASCVYANSKHIAFHCSLTTSVGRKCSIALLQIWENADYQIVCEGGISRRVMVNPGPVSKTMD